MTHEKEGVMRRWRPAAVPAVSCSAFLLAVACGGDDDDTGAQPAGDAATAMTAGDTAMDQAMVHMDEVRAAAEAG